MFSRRPAPMQIRSITYFRAVAILFIVAGHVLYETAMPTESLQHGIAWKLLGGGTVYFVFISGFLFHRVFARRFNYRRFLAGKIDNVACPYLVMSVVALALFLALDVPISFFSFTESFASLDLAGRIGRITYLLGTGGHVVAYWYVPFVMIMFALSPLHMAFLRLPAPARIAIAGAFFALSLVLHKPLLDISKLHAVLYYQSAYLIGMLVSLHWERLRRHLAMLAFPVTLAALAVALADTTHGASIGNYFRELGDGYSGIDWMYLQKILLAFALLGWLIRVEGRDIPALTALADASFGIFFLHGVILRVVAVAGIGLHSGAPWLDFMILFAATLALAWALTRAVQLGTGARSRQLIGS